MMKRPYLQFSVLTLILAFSILLADNLSAQHADHNNQEIENSRIQAGYSLVWSDEFNSSSIDTTVWNFWVGPAYNDELQFYTSRTENAFIDDGKLHLRAQKETYNGMRYTSARISTDSTSIGWKHGRFEASIKMPNGKGYWPAFWLMPIRDIGWPKGGEIDIMEFRGNEIHTTTGAVHFYVAGCTASSWECRRYINDSITLPEIDLTDSFNQYALEWTEDELIWFFNGTEFQRVQIDDIDADFNPFSTPFYIILNLAIGGNFLENPDESTPFPQSLVVDYVRVYQKK
jgi:beta-glucanase (GH16 family)